MAQQLGRAFLLKIGDGGGTEVFTTIDELRGTSMTFGEESVDITSKDSSGIRQLLAGSIKNTVTVTADGVWDDTATQIQLHTDFAAGTSRNFQIVLPGGTAGGTFEGPFRITSLEFGGDYDAEVTYSLTLESAGTIAFS